MEALPKYLIAILGAWLIANAVKITINFYREKRLSKRPIFSTGGMPSAHTAPAVALAAMIALSDGIDSVVFAIAFLFMIIVMTDAVQVRRAVGEQGELLRKTLKDGEKQPYFARGHTPLQVFVGALIGLLIGVLTYYLI